MYTTDNTDVNLKVGADTGNAKKDIVQLAKSIVSTFKGTDKEVNKTTSSMQSLENRIIKTSDKLSDLRTKQAELGKQQIPTEQYASISDAIDKMYAKLEKLGAKSIELQKGPQTTKTQTQLQNIEQEADKLQSSITYNEEALQRLVNTGQAFTLGKDTTQYANLTRQIQYTENEMDMLNTKHDEAIAKQNKEVSIADRLKSSFRSVGNTGRKIVDAFKSMAKQGTKAFNNIEKSTKKSIFTLLKYTLGIRSLFILFRRLRSTATEALKAMGQKFPEVQKDLNNLKSAFTGFKASIGTAFQPLLAAATPVLITIINLATAAANAIGSLFAALTGQDYVYKATAANNDYADSVSGVGKAAKEANKQLGQYDELMVIQQDNKTDSGGGGTAGDTGMNWEKVPVDDSIQDLANRIKEAWEKADFFDIGEELGKNIKDKLDNINWDKLKDTAEKAGKSLATFLNGFFQSGVLASTGTAISEALNTAVRGALGFVENFDWGQNGVEFGKMFNNLVKYFDEKAFAKLIADTLKGALDFVTGFFTEADFKELGKKVGNFLSELTMEIPELTVKIAKLAWTIAKDAAGFVAGVNETNPFLIDLLACLGILKVASLGFTIPNIVVYATIAKIGWDLGNTIYDNLDKDENGDNIIDKFVEATGIGDLAVNISDAFDEAMDVDGVFESFKTALSGYAGAIKKWVTEYIIDPWKEALGIGEGASGGGGGGPEKDGESFIQKFKDGVANIGANIKEWFHNTITKPISDKWDEIKDKFSLNISIPDIKANIEQKWNDIKTWFSTNGIDLAQYIGDNIKDKIDNIKNAWEGWKVKKKELQAKVTGGAEKAIKTVKSAWNGFKVKAKNLKLNVTGTAEKVLNKVKEILDAVKGKAYSFKLAFQDTFTGPIRSAWNAIADKINGAIDVMNKIPKVNIPHVRRLAKGGVIPPNKEFMAILGDQKQGTNIETPLETMVQAFNMALDRRGGDSSSNHEPIVLQLDGRTVAKVVWDENQKRYKQTGRYSPAY